MATEQTATRKLKKVYSRVPFVRWDKGVTVKGRIERGMVKPGRFGEQRIMQIVLEEACTFTDSSKKSVTIPSGCPVNITVKGGCSGLWDLAIGTYVEVECLGKEPASNGSEAWAFDVACEE